MKHIKRLFILIVLLIFSAVFINSRTRFFKDIGSNVPYLGEHYPHIAEYISGLSDDINEAISHIPTPSEILAKLKNTDIPIDPDDIASNVYYASDTMLNFYQKQNISIDINEDNKLDVYGISDSDSDKYLVYRFLDSSGNTLEQYTEAADSQGKFRKIMSIPENTCQFTVFTGSKQFGDYTSKVYNYIYLTADSNGKWSTVISPVYENNITKYEKSKSVSTALKNTYSVCSQESSIQELAKSITNMCTTEYDKALAIHDWVCENIYYDADSITGNTNNAPYVASDVLEKKRAVCLGYANLYAALCRAVSIPCNVVTGYALGATDTSDSQWTEASINSKEANHAWNEVYIDNRWVIVDTTWDCQNKIKNSTPERNGDISHLYFDANIKFFSTNHKIIEYVRR